MNKSRSHRKRHVPPGPVGVWFRTQQQQLQSNKDGNDKKSNHSQRSPSEASHCKSRLSDKSNSKKRTTDNSFSPVWSNVQDSLNLATPYLSSWNGDPKQKYDELRPHLPPHFLLLKEIMFGDYDFAIPPSFRLLLLVNSIESHNLHSICTVELHDETGFSIRAWVEPRFVQEQMQKQQEDSVIRTGVVWMLKEVGVMVQMNEDDEEVERILLIGEKHISKVWKPEDAKNLDFCHHMEMKKAISQNVSIVNDEVGEFQVRSVEQYFHEIGEYFDQESRYKDIGTGDRITCTEAHNDFKYHTKIGDGEISKAALHVVPTDQSTPFRNNCNALVQNTSNGTDRYNEENPKEVTQRSKGCRRPKSPAEMQLPNRKKSHNDPASREYSGHSHVDAKPSASKKPRKCSSLSSGTSTQLERGTSISCSSSGASLWDNLKGDATLQCFDENDEHQNDATNFPGHHSMQGNAPTSSIDAAKQQDENTPNDPLVETLVSRKNVTNGGSVLSSSLSQYEPGNSLSLSLFDAANLAGIDLSALDDEDE